jgi:hypothetical protein
VRDGAVPWDQVAAHYKLHLEVGARNHVRCPLPDHPDRDPSFRADGEKTWVCTCGAGTTDKFIYLMEAGSRDGRDAEAWRLANAVVEKLGGTPRDGAVARLNDSFAQVIAGGRPVYLYEKPGAPDVAWWSKGAFLDYHAGEKVRWQAPKQEADGRTQMVEKSAPLAHYWLAHPDRRRYDEVHFAPEGEARPGALNLYRGLAVEPAPGDWGLFDAHLREVVAAGREDVYTYLRHWLAWLVQRPGTPPETAIVLRSDVEGTGKTIVGTILKRQFHEANAIILNKPEQLTGRFDFHLANRVLIVADEAVFAGDARGADVLKGLITGGELAFEAKGRDVIQLPNCAHLLVTSNHPWVVRVAREDRRWCVLEVAPHRANDRPYFKAMVEQMRGGGLAALLHDLLAVDLTEWHPYPPPQTEARVRHQMRGLSTVERWWGDKLWRGYLYNEGEPWPGRVWVPDLAADLKEHASGERWQAGDWNSAALGRTLSRLLGGQNSTVKRQQDVEGKPAVRCYDLPPLDVARGLFATALKLDVRWPVEGEDLDDVPF